MKMNGDRRDYTLETSTKQGDAGTENQLMMDAFREIGNIAAAHAATALSKVVGDSIMIDISDSRVVPVENVSQEMGDVSQRVSVVYMETMDTELTFVIMIVPYEQSLQLADTFLRREKNPGRTMTELDKGALLELGNICICAYINAISKFTGATMMPAPPSFACDMLGAILEMPASIMAESSNFAFVIETNFLQKEESIAATIIFLPSSRSRELTLQRFGINKKR